MLDCKLIKRLIDIKCIYHIIAIRRDVHWVVAVIPDRIGVAHLVEPEDRHPFAEMRGSEQAVDEDFVSVWPMVLDEVVHLFASGRETREIEREPADQARPVRLGGGLQVVLLELILDKDVDRVRLNLYRGSAFGKVWPNGLDIRPMTLPGCSLFDPGLDKRCLLRSKGFPCRFRRHLLFGIGRNDSPVEFAGMGVLGYDYSDILLISKKALLGVEPEVGFALVLVGTVARIAVLGQNGPDVAIEIDRGVLGFWRTPSP